MCQRFEQAARLVGERGGMDDRADAVEPARAEVASLDLDAVPMARLDNPAEDDERALSLSGEAAGDVSAELDSLFGESAPAEPVDRVEELERKFWALMRIMARKGLLTNEEFTRELDDEEGN